MFGCAALFLLFGLDLPEEKFMSTFGNILDLVATYCLYSPLAPLCRLRTRRVALQRI